MNYLKQMALSNVGGHHLVIEVPNRTNGQRRVNLPSARAEPPTLTVLVLGFLDSLWDLDDQPLFSGL